MEEIIIKTALSTQFTAEQLDRVMSVINGTHKPELAVMILLGNYQEPQVEPRKIVRDRKSTLISYDKWSDSVTFEYEYPEKLNIYVAKDLDESILTLENYQDYKRSYSEDQVKSVHVLTGKTSKSTDQVSLETWNKSKSWFS